MPRLRALTPGLPLILTTVSFAFILLSLTSSTWSVQHVYDPQLGITIREKPLYTRERSPFQICEAIAASTSNATTSTVTTTYSVSCRKYSAYGTNKTSCESYSTLGTYDRAQAGDERLCQQIHRSGNLVIASTTFITLGFALTLLLSLLSLLPIKSSSAPPPSSSEESTTQTHHQTKTSESSLTPLIAFLLIASLAIGALTAILSQFYAILAFVMSQPPNGAFSSAKGNVIDPSIDDGSGPWIEGVALKAYLTVAWVFAGAGAITAGGVWRLPRWERL